MFENTATPALEDFSLNRTFKIVVVDRDEQWVLGLCSKMQHEHGLKLDVRLVPFAIVNGGGRCAFIHALTNIVLLSQVGICRPLYRFSSPDGDMSQEARHDYETNKIVCECSLSPIVWVANEADRRDPCWPDFHRWASSNRHCIINEDADWTDLGGSFWRAALLSAFYLKLRAQKQDLERTFPCRVDLHKRKLPSRRIIWPLEQKILFSRLRVILQRKRMLLQYDVVAAHLDSLLYDG